MSTIRTPMIWGGGALACAGLISLILRLVGAHGRLPYLSTLAPSHYYGAAAGALLLGLVLVFAAPADRNARRRVRLEERPVQENTTLRPARHHGIPTTSGFATTKPEPPRAQPTPAATPRPSQNTHASAAAQQAVMESPAKAAWGRPRAEEAPHVPSGGPAASGHRAHPNDSHAEAPARPAILSPDAEEAYSRQRLRRDQLHERLEALEQKANQAKVRFGLGKVSAAGYRQYLAEVDQERMMIESELMEGEE